MLLLRCEVIMKNKNKQGCQALLTSRSLDKRTAVESQINDLYLTPWVRYYNVFLYSKSCTRGTQCHQGTLWRYGFVSACSCTGCTKLASRLIFRWRIGENDPVQQIYKQEPHCQMPSVTRNARCHWLWFDIILAEQRECISSENFLMEAGQSCVCVNWHPQPRLGNNYTYVKWTTN